MDLRTNWDMSATAWQPLSDEAYDRLKGRLVTDADGLPVGTPCAVFHLPAPVTGAFGRYIFLVEPDRGSTLFEHSAPCIDEEVVRSVEGDRVRLDVPRDRLGGDLVRPPANIAAFRRR
jgi:hypothetical protein